MHEIVHAYNNEFGFQSKEIICFREGLATNLSNQNYKKIDLKNLNFEDLVKIFIT